MWKTKTRKRKFLPTENTRPIGHRCILGGGGGGGGGSRGGSDGGNGGGGGGSNDVGSDCSISRHS